MRRTTWMVALLVAGLTFPVQAATVRYVHTDALGSVVAKTDENRVVLERREYEPYGRQLGPGNLQEGPGYTGHVQDAVTGLTYMQQRYYDPGLGRFLSVDPVTAHALPANFNRYWYANNNPFKFTDPDGRRSICLGKHSCRVIQVSSVGPIGDLDGAPRSNNETEEVKASDPPKTWDPVTDKRISTLHPEVQGPAADFVNEVEQEYGIRLRVSHAYRSSEEQAELYAQGRTKPGNIVTNAEPGESYHNYRLAFDVVEIRGGQANWQTNWDAIGETGEEFGFEWGGRWSRPDRPHFQMTFGYDIEDLQTGVGP